MTNRKVILALLALAGAMPALAESYVLEPETQSVWVQTNYGYDGPSFEWQTDGTLLRYVGPFNPFGYRDPRATLLGSNNQAGTFAGKFALSANYRGYYTRRTSGGWDLNLPFAQAGDFGCNEGASSSACLTVLFKDGRGREGIVTTSENKVAQVWYWTGTAYRAATELERQLLVDGRQVMFDDTWAPDESFFVKPGATSEDGVFSYLVMTEAGAQNKNVTLKPGSYVTTFRPNGEKWLAVAHHYEQITPDTYRLSIVLYDVADVGGAPVATERWRVTQTGVEQRLSALGHVSDSFYYGIGVQIRRLSLVTANDQELTQCPASASLSTVTVQSGKSVLTVCGAQATLWKGAEPAWTVALSSDDFYGGALLVDEPGRYDLIMGMRNGDYERHRVGQPVLRSRLSPIDRPPSLSFGWEERDQVCGVNIVEADRHVFCRGEGTWIRVDHPIGKPASTHIAGGYHWALSRTAEAWALYRLKTIDADGDGWKLVQTWPLSEREPRFVPAIDQIAVDVGDDGLWTLSGETFVKTHVRARLPVAFRSGLDKDMNLYDVCEQVDSEHFRVCLIKPDGAMTPLAIEIYVTPMVSDAGRIVPMARGVIYTGPYETNPFVLRGARLISLGQLHGEFERPAATYQNLNYVEMGGGRLIIDRQRPDPASMYILHDFFIFDGSRLDVARVNPPRHRLEDRAYHSESSQAWIGADGLWRTFSKNTPDMLAFGETPAEAFFAGLSVEPNHVNHALVQDDRAYLATDDGLWSCGLAKATVVTNDTAELARDADCARIRRGAHFDRVYAVGGRYVAQQGRTIGTLATLDARLRPLSASATARALAVDGDVATWIEDGLVVRYDLVAERRIQSRAPGSAATATVKGAWFCDESGLFREDGGVWVRALDACLGLEVIAGDAYVATSDHLAICKASGASPCSDFAWPRPFLRDSRMGRVPAGAGQQAAVALGQRLYAIDVAGTFTDVTPTYAAGSLLLTPTAFIEDGLIGLRGGGLIALPAATGLGDVRHVRIE